MRTITRKPLSLCLSAGFWPSGIWLPWLREELSKLGRVQPYPAYHAFCDPCSNSGVLLPECFPTLAEVHNDWLMYLCTEAWAREQDVPSSVHIGVPFTCQAGYNAQAEDTLSHKACLPRGDGLIVFWRASSVIGREISRWWAHWSEQSVLREAGVRRRRQGTAQRGPHGCMATARLTGRARGCCKLAGHLAGEHILVTGPRLICRHLPHPACNPHSSPLSLLP